MTSTTNVHSSADGGRRSRLLVELSSEAVATFLDYISNHYGSSMKDVVIMANFDAKRLFMVVPFPERFQQYKMGTQIVHEGVTYPIVAIMESEELNIRCSSHEWTTFFTPDGQNFITVPNFHDQVVLRHIKLVRQEAHLKKTLKRFNRIGKPESAKESVDETETKVKEARARKNKKARERRKRQKARQKELEALKEEKLKASEGEETEGEETEGEETEEEESEEEKSDGEKADFGTWTDEEIEALEEEVLVRESKVTKEKMDKAIMVRVRTVTAYKTNLIRAKRIGYKIVRRFLLGF